MPRSLRLVLIVLVVLLSSPCIQSSVDPLDKLQGGVTTTRCLALGGVESVDGGFCFVAESALFTWADARDNCRDYGVGWDLASIGSLAEFNQLAALESASFWTSLNDVNVEDDFINADGTTGYTDWDTNQPAGSGDCVYKSSSGGAYKDANCDTTLRSFCKARLSDASALTPAECNALGGRIYDDSRCFVKEETPMNLSEALIECRTQGMELVTVNDADVYSFLYDNMGLSWWTQLNDIATEASWEHFDGSPVISPIPWMSTGSTPNDSGGDQECVCRYTSSDGLNDEDCAADRGFVCQARTLPAQPVSLTPAAATTPQNGLVWRPADRLVWSASDLIPFYGAAEGHSWCWWMNPDDSLPSTWSIVFTRADTESMAGESRQPSILMSPQGTLWIADSTGSDINEHIDVNSPVVRPNRWTHYCMTHKTGHFAVYADGAVLGEDMGTAGPATSTENVYGGDRSATATYVDAPVDVFDLRYFPVALSAGRVREQYLSTQSSVPSFDSELDRVLTSPGLALNEVPAPTVPLSPSVWQPADDVEWAASMFDFVDAATGHAFCWWVRPYTALNSEPKFSVLFSRSPDTSNPEIERRPTAFFHPNSTKLYLVDSGLSEVEALSPPSSLAVDAYTHVCWSHRAGEMSVYYNGVLDATTSGTDGPHDSTYPLFSGSRSSQFADAEAHVSDLRYFARAITAAEVLAVYDSFDADLFASSTSQTWSAWFRVSSTTAGPMFSKGGTPQLFEHSGSLVVAVGGQAAPVQLMPPPGTWSHIAIVSHSTTLTIYEHGVETHSIDIGGFGSNAGPLVIADEAVLEVEYVPEQASADFVLSQVQAGACTYFVGARRHTFRSRDQFSLSGSFTVSLWFASELVAVPDGQVELMLTHGISADSERFYLGFRDATTLTCTYEESALDVTIDADSKRDFHHYACVFDADSGARILYRDGVELGRDTSGLAYVSIARRLHFNGHHVSTAKLDQIGVWSRALSAAEIAAQFWRLEYSLDSAIVLHTMDAVDESSGDFVDSSGNDNNFERLEDEAVISGGRNPAFRGQCPMMSKCSECQALRLASTSEFETESAFSLDSSDFTVSFWFRTDQTSVSSSFIVEHGTSSTTNQRLRMGFVSSTELGVDFFGNALVVDVATSVLTPNWHQYAVVYTASTGTRTLYVDGNALAEDTTSANAYSAGSAKLYVNPDGLSGEIDQLAVYSRALTVDEMEQQFRFFDYNASDAALEALYSFPGSLDDASSNDNNLVLVGGTAEYFSRAEFAKPPRLQGAVTTHACLAAGGLLSPDAKHCFVIVTDTKTWDDARAYCRAFGVGWNLASITSHAEWTMLTAAESANFWIGLTDRNDEGNFVYVDGAPVWVNWWTAQPNNNGDCVEMYDPDDQQFADSDCDFARRSVCKAPISDERAMTQIECQVLGGSLFGSRCYVKSTEQMNVTDAISHCASLGMELVTLNDDATYEFLNDTFGLSWWTQLNDISSEGTYEHFDGSRVVSPIPWMSTGSTPNDASGIQECVGRYTSSDGLNDDECGRSRSALCQSFVSAGKTYSAVSVSPNGGTVKAGASVTLTFSTSVYSAREVVLVSDVAVEATSSNGLDWTAVYVVGGVDEERQIPLSPAPTDGTVAPTVDLTPPTAQLAYAGPSPTASTPLVVDVTVAGASGSPTLQPSDFVVAFATVSSTTATTVTLAATDLDAENAITVQIKAGVVSDDAGNTNAASNVVSIVFDRGAPVFESVDIASDNTNTSFATTGDVITVTFTTDEVLDVEASSVTLLGDTLNVSSVSSTTYRSMYTTQASDQEGPVEFTVTAEDSFGNTASTSETEGVWFESGNPPQLSSVVATSSSADPALTSAGDTVTVTFDVNEPIEAASVRFWYRDGAAAVVAAQEVIPDARLSASLEVDADDASGVLEVLITASDFASNEVSTNFTLGDVVLDTVAPDIVSVDVAVAGVPDQMWALPGDLVRLEMEFSESVALVVAEYEGSSAAVSAGAFATERVIEFTVPPATESYGRMLLQVEATDDAGNSENVTYATGIVLVDVLGSVGTVGRTTEASEYWFAYEPRVECSAYSAAHSIAASSGGGQTLSLSIREGAPPTASVFDDSASAVAPSLLVANVSGSPLVFGLLESVADSYGVSVTLSCRAILNLDRTSVSFASRDVSLGPSDAIAVTVTNVGSAVLSISSAVPDNAVFAVSVSGGSLSAIAGGESVVLDVTFDPSVTGAAAGSIDFASNSHVPASVALSGTGVEPRLAQNATALVFANVPYPSSPSEAQVLRLSNSGSSVLTVSAVSLSGTDASAFSLLPESALPADLNPDDEFLVSVACQAQSVTPASLTARVDIESSDPTAVDPHVDLSASVVHALTLTPSSLNFGDRLVLLKTPDTLSVDVTSLAQGISIELTQLSVSASPFSVANEAVVVPPGATRTVSVAFHPVVPGVFTGELRVDDNSTGVQSVLDLAGRGVVADCSVYAGDAPGSTLYSPTRGGAQVELTLELHDVSLDNLLVQPNLTSAALVQSGEWVPSFVPNCTLDQSSRVVESSTRLSWQCAVSPGVGADWSLRVRSDKLCGFMAEPAGTLSYVKPRQRRASLGLLDGVGTEAGGLVQLTTSNSALLKINGTNFGAQPAEVRVLYNQAGVDSAPYVCEVEAMDHEYIECRTTGGEVVPNFARNLTFTVEVGNQASPDDASNALILFAKPVVTSVSGCPVQSADGRATSQCPTGGNVRLTVGGSQFDVDGELQVLIGSRLCTNVSVVEGGELLYCTLPAGRGANVGVTPVSVSNCTLTGGLVQYGNSAPLVSYEGPVIESIGSAACESDGALTLVECPTEGQYELTVRGSNFGADQWRVDVGGSECENPTSTDVGLTIRCTMPSGTFVNQRVTVVDVSGQASTSLSSPALVSYFQCPAGQFLNGTKCFNCSLGEYSQVRGQTQCLKCAAGRFAAEFGQSECDPCRAGFVSSEAGASECDPCEVGKAQPLEEKTSCDECQPGSYNDEGGRAVCKTCAPGTISSGTAATSCVPCGNGTLEQDARKSCVPCAVGSASSNATSERCDLCPTGKFSNQTGQSACWLCAPGRFASQAGSFACQLCAPGRFANVSGLSECLPCASGLVAVAAGALGCERCNNGTIEVDRAECKLCSVGKYSSNPADEVCSECAAGKYAPEEGMAACQGCDAGAAQPQPGQASCTNCSAGRFASWTGFAQCVECPVGSVAPLAGALECVRCDNGTVEERRQLCRPCAVGKYSSSPSDGVCSECPAGKYAPEEGMAACLDCEPGTAQALPGQGSCGNCSAGTFTSDSGRQTCDDCPAGSVALLKGAAACVRCENGTVEERRQLCRPCAVGKYSSNPSDGVCSECPAGKYASEEGMTACLNCEPGTAQALPGQGSCGNCSAGTFTSDSGRQTCDDCPAGSVALLKGAAACVRCENGTVEERRQLCRPCAAGKYSTDPEGGLCVDCAAGKYAPNSSMTACLDCEPGTAQQTPGQASCTACSVGRFSNQLGLVECEECKNGRYSTVEGALRCLSCPDGTIEERRQACRSCAVGKYSSSPADSTCTDCPAGRFASEEERSECQVCPAGTAQSSPGQPGCVECPVGRYTAEDGATICQECQPGFNSSEVGSTGCTRCPNGTIEELGSQCRPCAVGKYSRNPADGVCADCPAGRFASREGSSECEPCSPGTAQSSPGQPGCLNCTAGRHASAAGAQTCIECAAGFHVPGAGATACVRCPNGTIEERRSQCRPCAAGKFSGHPADSICTPCAPGRYAVNEGATECEPCPHGMQQSSSGQAFCLNCTLGRYGTDVGQAACAECEPGTVSEQPGSRECRQCHAGSIALGGRQCQPCPIGTSSFDPTDPVCTDCPAGRVATTIGQSNCSPCRPGTFIDRPGGAVCFLCEAGKFSNTSGTAACKQCPRNFVTSKQGLTACRHCPTLQFTRLPGVSECEHCATNEYAVFELEPDPKSTQRVFKTCEECVGGANCNGFGAASAREGVWVVERPDGRVESSRCLPGRCEQCDDDVLANTTSAAVACCSENRAPADENPMCARCANDYVEWGGECIECKETNAFLVAMLLGSMFLVVAIMHGLNQDSNPLTLVFFYYVQMVLLLFGEETEWLAWMSFFNLNPLNTAGGGQCVAPWSSVTRLVLNAVSPLLTWVFLGVIAGVHVCVNLWLTPVQHRKDIRTLLAPYKRSCLAFVLFSYNTIASASLQFFECVDVGGGKWRVVRSIPDIDCRSDEYRNATPIFLVCLVVVILGPFLIARILHRPRILRLAGRMHDDEAPVDDHPLRRQLSLRNLARAREHQTQVLRTKKDFEDERLYHHIWGVLYDMFRGETSWLAHMWNAFVLARRVVVVAVSVLSFQYGRRTRYAALTIAHLVTLLLHMIFEPYRDLTMRGEYADVPDHVLHIKGDAVEAHHAGPRIRVNLLESISLLLLTVFSAVIGSMDVPFNDTQAIVLSSMVFMWTGVLMLSLVVRALIRRRAKQRKQLQSLGTTKSMRDVLPSSASVNVQMATIGALDRQRRGDVMAGEVLPDEDVEDIDASEASESDGTGEAELYSTAPRAASDSEHSGAGLADGAPLSSTGLPLSSSRTHSVQRHEVDG